MTTKPETYTARTSRAALAFAGFMLLAGVAPSDASASCGDYLVVQSERQMMTEHSNSAASDDHSRTAERPAKQPCHGPGCENRSSLPATPVPLVPSSGQSKQATACGNADAITGFLFSGTTAGTAARARSGFPTDVLRPPRAAMLTSRS